MRLSTLANLLQHVIMALAFLQGWIIAHNALCYIGVRKKINKMLLPRCMKCRRGLAIRILSVRLPVCPSDMFRFLYHTKNHLA